MSQPIKSIQEQVQDLFLDCIQSQTNWGKNQIEKLYLECVTKVYHSNAVVKPVEKPSIPHYISDDGSVF
jgi:hypothetical protein